MADVSTSFTEEELARLPPEAREALRRISAERSGEETSAEEEARMRAAAQQRRTNRQLDEREREAPLTTFGRGVGELLRGGQAGRPTTIEELADRIASEGAQDFQRRRQRAADRAMTRREAARDTTPTLPTAGTGPQQQRQLAEGASRPGGRVITRNEGGQTSMVRDPVARLLDRNNISLSNPGGKVITDTGVQPGAGDRARAVAEEALTFLDKQRRDEEAVAQAPVGGARPTRPATRPARRLSGARSFGPGNRLEDALLTPEPSGEGGVFDRFLLTPESAATPLEAAVDSFNANPPPRPAFPASPSRSADPNASGGPVAALEDSVLLGPVATALRAPSHASATDEVPAGRRFRPTEVQAGERQADRVARLRRFLGRDDVTFTPEGNVNFARFREEGFPDPSRMEEARRRGLLP